MSVKKKPIKVVRKSAAASTSPLSKTVTSLDQLIKELSPLAANDGVYWFRGHADIRWPLVPGYFREKDPVDEDYLLKKFKQNAALLIDNIPTTSFDWLLWMQHYGVPTRLLDWSESPLVALYFAVVEPKGDAALWILDPLKFNDITKNERFYENYIPSLDIDHKTLAPYSVESFAAERKSAIPPVAVLATRNNARLMAQQGVFTISHRDTTPIEKIGDGSHISVLKIPEEHKPKILKELKICGITGFQLFPELSSIGLNLKEKFFK